MHSTGFSNTRGVHLDGSRTATPRRTARPVSTVRRNVVADIVAPALVVIALIAAIALPAVRASSVLWVLAGAAFLVLVSVMPRTIAAMRNTSRRGAVPRGRGAPSVLRPERGEVDNVDDEWVTGLHETWRKGER